MPEDVFSRVKELDGKEVDSSQIGELFGGKTYLFKGSLVHERNVNGINYIYKIMIHE